MYHVLGTPTVYMICEYAKFEYFDRSLRVIKPAFPESSGLIEKLKGNLPYEQEEWAVRHLRAVRWVLNNSSDENSVKECLNAIIQYFFESMFWVRDLNHPLVSDSYKAELRAKFNQEIEGANPSLFPKHYSVWLEAYNKLGIIDLPETNGAIATEAK